MPGRLTALLLRTPLRRFARSALLLHLPDEDVALTYHQQGQVLTVLADASAGWWRTLGAGDQRTAEVEVTLDGTRHQGTIRFLSGDELDAALIPYLQAHPGAWTTLGVAPNASEDDVATAAQSAGVAQITLAG